MGWPRQLGPTSLTLLDLGWAERGPTQIQLQYAVQVKWCVVLFTFSSDVNSAMLLFTWTLASDWPRWKHQRPMLMGRGCQGGSSCGDIVGHGGREKRQKVVRCCCLMSELGEMTAIMKVIPVKERGLRCLRRSFYCSPMIAVDREGERACNHGCSRERNQRPREGRSCWWSYRR